jgi:cytochrome c-type biogenesis protein CcmH/NrfG
MDISKRLAELARMKAEGHLSDESFESLTQSAIQESLNNSSETTTSDVKRKDPSFKVAPRKALLGVAAAVFAVVVLVLMNTRSSDPMESKEYKKLLEVKKELIAKQAALEVALQENPEQKEELALIVAKLAMWKDAIAMILESDF